jgi:hypothetical protein
MDNIKKIITMFIYNSNKYLYLIHSSYYKNGLQRGTSVEYKCKLAPGGVSHFERDLM